MQRINFSNLPNQTTPVNATNLNQLQTNVDEGKVDKSTTEYTGDLNDLVTTGFYTTTGATAHKPTNDNYYIEVIRQSTGYILQRATRRMTGAGLVEYLREDYNGTWTEWILTLNKKNGVYVENLGTGINLNDIKSAGEYGIYGNNTNSPVSGAIAILKVEAYSGDWLIQTITTVGDYIYMYKRSFHSGTTWSSWKQIHAV